MAKSTGKSSSKTTVPRKTTPYGKPGNQPVPSATPVPPSKPTGKAAGAGPADSPYPRVGRSAPKFTAKTHEGRDVSLTDFKGRVVVLYFYPKDNTSGCTVEAIGFRDNIADFTREKVQVLGVSPDSVSCHQSWAQKLNLPFLLLSDPDHAIAEAYGVWQEKSMYGRKYMGIARTTFIIDEGGKIAHVFEKVKPAGHAEEVIAWIRGHFGSK